MAKINRYWRCNCNKNNSRLTVKSAKEAAPICKKCGHPMKREGHTKNKTGSLKAKMQIRGVGVSLTASDPTTMDILKEDAKRAKRNRTGLALKEEMITWQEAARRYKASVETEHELKNISESSKKAYLISLANVVGIDTEGKDRRWVEYAAQEEAKRKEFYSELRRKDPTAMDIRDRYLQDVTVADVKNFLRYQLAIGRARQPINNTLARIQAVYKELCKECDVAHYQRLHNARARVRDVSGLRKPANAPEVPRLYTAEEIDYLLKFYEPYPEWHFIMFGVVKLMMRITAMKSFKLSNFNFKDMTYKTPPNSKGGKIETLPLPESFAVYLKKWVEDRPETAEGWLLRSPTKPGERWSGDHHLINKVQARIAEDLVAKGGLVEDAERIGRLTTHKIGRHTGASIQKFLKVEMQFATPKTRSEAMTHNQEATTAFYAHDNLEQLRALVDAYDRFTSIPGKVILPPPPLQSKKVLQKHGARVDAVQFQSP